MHNFLGIQNKVNNFRKGLYTDPYDEPTYLMFALDFNFDEPNTSMSGDTFLWRSPLFSDRPGQDSAMQYLTNNGFTPEANAMSVFKKILKYLTFDQPWYFQELSGLNEMWKQATNIEVGQKGKGLSLTVKTLEAVDLRMTEVASIYRGCIYDKTNMRERVPDNLRWFSVDIYIAEARNLRYRLPGIGNEVANTLGVNTSNISTVVGSGNLLTDVLRQYGYVKFRCRQCEFDFSESFAGGATQYAATKNTPATSSFKIKIGYFEEESRYADGSQLWDDSIKNSIRNPWGTRSIGAGVTNIGSFLTGLPHIGDNLSEAGQSLQNSLATIGGLINPALGAAAQFIQPPVTSLGTMYNGSSLP